MRLAHEERRAGDLAGKVPSFLGHTAVWYLRTEDTTEAFANALSACGCPEKKYDPPGAAMGEGSPVTDAKQPSDSTDEQMNS